MSHRTLVAGFGNALRGDDGFGVAVIRELQESAAPVDADVIEIGTGGVALAQALLAEYDRLVIVDAMTRGGKPGTLYVLQVDDVESPRSIDMHLAVPSRALGLAKAIGALPRQIYLVGCEPGEIDDLDLALSPPVRAALDYAVREVRRLVAAGHA